MTDTTKNTMGFEGALAALKAGKKVRRRGWESTTRYFELGPSIVLRDPAGSPTTTIVNRPTGLDWIPVTDDLLATDWEVVELRPVAFELVAA